MTRISEVHGIPSDEFQDRGNMVMGSDYIPYLSVTKGEMRLMLARQRAQILAQWYGKEAPQYQKAVEMIDNALHQGIVRGVYFVGALHDPYLQQVAKIIQSASRQNAPASKNGITLRNGMNGIGQIIPYEDRRKACEKAARDKVKALQQCKTTPYATGSYCDMLLDAEFRKCSKQFNIEKILNDGVEKSGHHVLYKDLPAGYSLPTEVIVKRTFHQTGVEGMALVGKIDKSLMYQWVENGIIAKNAQDGSGPLNSVESSFYLSPDPQSALAQYRSAKSKKTGGIGVIDPVTGAIVVKIIGAIAGALTAAAVLLKALRSQEAYAMSEARGFGTDAFSGKQSDWVLSGTNQPGTATNKNTILLIGGAAALLLLSDEK